MTHPVNPEGATAMRTYPPCCARTRGMLARIALQRRRQPDGLEHRGEVLRIADCAQRRAGGGESHEAARGSGAPRPTLVLLRRAGFVVGAGRGSWRKGCVRIAEDFRFGGRRGRGAPGPDRDAIRGDCGDTVVRFVRPRGDYTARLQCCFSGKQGVLYDVTPRIRYTHLHP